MVQRIFGPEGEVTGGWRKLHTDELHNKFVLFAKYW
jgi:hypothetical protein